MPIWRFNSCIAVSKEPAATWSAAQEELATHDALALTPSEGDTNSSSPPVRAAALDLAADGSCTSSKPRSRSSPQAPASASSPPAPAVAFFGPSSRPRSRSSPPHASASSDVSSMPPAPASATLPATPAIATSASTKHRPDAAGHKWRGQARTGGSVSEGAIKDAARHGEQWPVLFLDDGCGRQQRAGLGRHGRQRQLRGRQHLTQALRVLLKAISCSRDVSQRNCSHHNHTASARLAHSPHDAQAHEVLRTLAGGLQHLDALLHAA